MTLVVTWLWQGLALAALTAIVLRALPRVNAATHHLTLWTALAAILGIPLMLAAGALRDQVGVLPLPPAGNGFDAALVLPAAPRWVAVLCTSTWTAVALVSLVRIVRGGHVLRMLRRNSTPFDPAREARLPLWLEAGRSARRRAELRISNDLAGACALGFGRPVILVSRRLADALDDAALDQIVMHEQAHLVRRDDWWQLLQVLVCAVAGLHPAVWWLSRRIDLEREAACDDHVVARTGAARQYARALLDAAMMTGSRHVVPALVPGATGRASTLRLRVARLLDPQRPRGVRPTPIAALTMAVPVLGILACPHLATFVAFLDAVEQALPSRSASTLAAVVPASAPAVNPPAAITVQAPVAGAAGNRGQQEAPESATALTPAPDEPTVPEPPQQVEPAAALLESRVPVTAGNAALAIAAPAGTMDSPKLAATRGQASWQTLANTTSNIAKGTASSVASGAGRSGLAIGRAFTRAGQAIGGSF
jgi:beta-lactamase regulating signal transducer with metallopeptidase domain